MSAGDRSFRIIINPVAGRGRAPAHALPVAKLLRQAGHEVEIVYTTTPADAKTETERAATDGAVAVATGGDGMVALVAGAAARCGATLGIVPAGRGNDFARQLGILAGDGAEAMARVLAAGEPRAVDMLDAGPRLVPGSVYVGIDSRASEILDRARWVPGPLQYPYAAIRAIATYSPADFTITLDGDRSEHHAATVVVANSGYYGSGMRIAPRAAVDDGLLDVVVVGAASRLDLIRSLPKVYDGRHAELDAVTMLRGSEVTVTAAQPLDAYADGDHLAPLPVTARVLPAALRVLAPAP